MSARYYIPSMWDVWASRQLLLLLLLMACAPSRHRLRHASATDLPGTFESVDFTEEALQLYRKFPVVLVECSPGRSSQCSAAAAAAGDGGGDSQVGRRWRQRRAGCGLRRSRIESVNVGVVVMNAFRSHKSRGVIMESYLPRASTASLDTVTEWRPCVVSARRDTRHWTLAMPSVHQRAVQSVAAADAACLSSVCHRRRICARPGSWAQDANCVNSRCSSLLIRQTVHTHRASVHQAAKLVAALLRVASCEGRLTAENNDSLPPGLWLTLPAGWLPRTGISSGTLRSAIEYRLPLLPFSLLMYRPIGRYRRWKHIGLSRALVRLANTLLKDGESARNNHILACNFAKYSPI